MTDESRSAYPIVDSHAYCFPPADSLAGHPTVEAHLGLFQWWSSFHHQPAWRVRDRAPADATLLLDPTPEDPMRLADVNFRVDRAHSRFVWTVDGEDFTKQSYPPNLYNLEYTPANLVAEMDYAGVDVALLHTDPLAGRDIRFQAECVRQYPDRLRSMIPIDQRRIPSDPDGVIADLVHAVRVLGLHALKFQPTYAYMAGRGPWDDGPFRPFWEAVRSLGIPVFFTLGNAPNATDERQGYLEELQVLERWLDRYPGVTCSITHGFPWRMYVARDRIELPEAVWQPFAHENLHLELSFPVRIGDLFDFPYRETLPAIREMRDRIGAQRILWGTDMPFQNRFCTYRQSRVAIEKYCDFLSPDELSWIMGRTAAKVLGL